MEVICEAIVGAVVTIGGTFEVGLRLGIKFTWAIIKGQPTRLPRRGGVKRLLYDARALLLF